MKKIILLVNILLINFHLFAQDKHALSVDDLWNMKRIGSFTVSEDGKKIIFDVTTYNMQENKGKSNLWIVNSDGTELNEFVNIDKSVSSPQIIKDKVFYNLGDQLFSQKINDTLRSKVTDFYSGVSGVKFAPSKNQIIFSSQVYADCKNQSCNKAKDVERANSKIKAEIFTELMYRHWNDWRGPKYNHLFLHKIGEGNYIDLNQDLRFDVPPIALGSANDYSFSPDGNEIAFTMNESNFLATSTNNDIFILNLADIKDNESTPYKKISNSLGNDNQPIYSPDGKYIAFCSMERAGFESDKQRIILYNRNLNIEIDLTSSIDLSAGEIIWSHDAKFIYFTAANTIYNSIYRIDISTKELFTIAEKVDVSTITLSPNGDKIFFKNQKSNLPYEIFSIDINGKNLKQITNINAELLSKIEMIPIETFWAEGAEDAKVQSILVKPPFFNPNIKYPLMFLIHGGPQGHWTDDFHYRWNTQMFAAQGYVVVATNPRGSFGYGQKFTDEISQDWGGKVYTDLMNSLDYAINNYDFIDSQNIFAAGASYGGYMINWIAGHTNRFNALICHAGVFNLESMYGTTEELWFPEWENGGTPWENRELYKKWSPHNYLQNFKTPMLVIHGEYDFRVPIGQAMELFTSLQRVGVKSRFLYFPDEYHFVTKPQNAKLWWNTIYDWLNENKK
ncbi:MAG: S9 family peptidase [Ignavibacteriae bacterium]|nr:S9 family peptidase [Ignavibacteriota bacterium]